MPDFVSSCGGLLGLFMGVSVLSVVELIYFFTLRLCCKIRQRETHPDDSGTWATRNDLSTVINQSEKGTTRAKYRN